MDVGCSDITLTYLIYIETRSCLISLQITYFLLNSQGWRTKKLFEFPVERDFANAKAFNAAHHPFLFQKFLRIRFFDIEVRFFGTAMQKLRGYSLL